MFSRAHTRARRAALLACATLGLTAAPASAASPDVAFPANGPAMEAAFFVAKSHWGKEPCGGTVAIQWADLAPGDAAYSHWMTFGQDPFAAPETNMDCRIEFNRRQEYDWPKLCTVAAHEIGHLLGHDHTADHTDLMAESYTRVLPACQQAAIQAGYVTVAPRQARTARRARARKRRATARSARTYRRQARQAHTVR